MRRQVGPASMYAPGARSGSTASSAAAVCGRMRLDGACCGSGRRTAASTAPTGSVQQHALPASSPSQRLATTGRARVPRRRGRRAASGRRGPSCGGPARRPGTPRGSRRSGTCPARRRSGREVGRRCASWQIGLVDRGVLLAQRAQAVGAALAVVVGERTAARLSRSGARGGQRPPPAAWGLPAGAGRNLPIRRSHKITETYVRNQSGIGTSSWL
jgi:hypothetical protein